mgnify:CR=1 FL=1
MSSMQPSYRLDQRTPILIVPWCFRLLQRRGSSHLLLLCSLVPTDRDSNDPPATSNLVSILVFVSRSVNDEDTNLRVEISDPRIIQLTNVTFMSRDTTTSFQHYTWDCLQRMQVARTKGMHKSFRHVVGLHDPPKNTSQSSCTRSSKPSTTRELMSDSRGSGHGLRCSALTHLGSLKLQRFDFSTSHYQLAKLFLRTRMYP